jgi:F0F1-type ATP synthase membrane subunit b/b'
MEVLVPVFEKFGPTGLTIIMMGGGLVYLTRWLREMQTASQEQHDKVRKEFADVLREKRTDYTTALQLERADFIETLKLQRADAERTIQTIVSKFEDSLHEIAEDLQGVKGEIGKLTDKVDNLRR